MIFVRQHRITVATGALALAVVACRGNGNAGTSTGSGTGSDTDTSTASATATGTGIQTGDDIGCPATEPDKWAGKPGTEHTEVTGNETWTAANSPHRISGAIYIDQNRVLTIEPCALVIAEDQSFVNIGWSERGDLVAVGSAEKPILFRGKDSVPGIWDGLQFYATGSKTHLSHVTIEYAGGESAAAAIMVRDDKAAPRIDHTTLRNGKGHGLDMSEGGRLAPQSDNNIISGFEEAPVRLDLTSIGSLVDGAYTGNTVDRVEVDAISGLEDDATWHRLSVPWFVRGHGVEIKGALTIEPGTRIVFESIAPDSVNSYGTFEFISGASLRADGGSAATPIVFDGEPDATGASWGGFGFQSGVKASILNHVTISHAGQRNVTGTDRHCHAPELAGKAVRAALQVADRGSVTITHTAFTDLEADVYAIDRNYNTADGGSDFGGGGNSFTGDPAGCGESDTLPANVDCDDSMTCCNRPYQCRVPVVAPAK